MSYGKKKEWFCYCKGFGIFPWNPMLPFPDWTSAVSFQNLCVFDVCKTSNHPPTLSDCSCKPLQPKKKITPLLSNLTILVNFFPKQPASNPSCFWEVEFGLFTHWLYDTPGMKHSPENFRPHAVPMHLEFWPLQLCKEAATRGIQYPIHTHCHSLNVYPA